MSTGKHSSQWQCLTAAMLTGFRCQAAARAADYWIAPGQDTVTGDA